MNKDDIIKFGVGGINVSDAQGLSNGIKSMNLGTVTPIQNNTSAPIFEITPEPIPAPVNNQVQVGSGISKIKEFFPNFRMYSAEELAQLKTEELARVFQDLNSTLERANSLRVQAQTQIEGKEEERKRIVAEVKERFGVETIAELQELKAQSLANFATLMTQLNNII